MRKLIATAAVVGLAVSSSGFTVQDEPEAGAAIGATGVAALDAQVGRHLERAMFGYVWLPHYRRVPYDNFSYGGLMGGHLPTIAGQIGASIGRAVGGRAGAAIGRSVGTW